MAESERFRVISIAELPEIAVPSAGIVWRPIRRTLGISAFGVNAYTAGPGEDVVEKHTESQLRHEELYVVVAGHARFQLDGEPFDAPAGTLVYVRDPDVQRHAVAEEPGTTVLAIGGNPGKHEVSAWEYFFPAYSEAGSGKYDQAIAGLHEGLREKPDHPALYYHLACIECRAGRPEEAAEHLARAVELDPKLAQWAAEDEDLAAISGRLGTEGEGA